MGDLDGKVVIVTGAGRGLGRSYALAIGAAGAAVLVNDIDADAVEDTAARLRSNRSPVAAVVGSVSSWKTAQSLVSKCRDEFGRVDGLVNNAGIVRHSRPWAEEEHDLRAVVEVNVLGVQFATTHAMEAMIEQGQGGSIVNIISGARLGIEGMSSYGASKGAVASMTHNWALEGRPHEIRVNAVSPLGRTQMAQADPRETRPSLPHPDVVAPLIVALLSDATSDVTGNLLRFDGEQLGRYEETLSPVAACADGWSVSDLVATLREANG